MLLRPLLQEREREAPFCRVREREGGGGCLCARGSAYCGWIGSLRLSGRLAPLWPARGGRGRRRDGQGYGGI